MAREPELAGRRREPEPERRAAAAQVAAIRAGSAATEHEAAALAALDDAQGEHPAERRAIVRLGGAEDQ